MPVATGQTTLLTSFTTFGDLLRYLRRRARLTQRELSIAVGYSESQISRLEQNERLPDLTTLIAVLAPALGIEHESETLVRLQELADKTRKVPAPPSPTPPRFVEPQLVDKSRAIEQPVKHNLPHQLTAFIGRTGELAALRQRLTRVRLITLTGSGGVGKTRLALEVAAGLQHTFADGVWLVELAALLNPTRLTQTVASVFKLPEQSERTMEEALIAYLQPKHLLLVLDNCEHLITACAELVEQLLRTSPHLYVLTTSRELLNIAGEVDWQVAPLTTPALLTGVQTAPTDVKVEQYEAIQLFLARGGASKPGFELTTQNAGYVAHICTQLDGIPLAIELAAARLKGLTIEQIAVRLQNRFELLTGGHRTALPRQQTLRATLDWSYDLLSEAEQLFFTRLAIFVGGWTLEAATALVTADDEQAGLNGTGLNNDQFDLLMQLVNKSLVGVDTQTDTPRYFMLETVREYALEKLVQRGELAPMQRSHATFFLTLAETASPQLFQKQQREWLARLKNDYANFNAALTWCQSLGGDPLMGLQMASALQLFWSTYYLNEGFQWIDTMLRHAGEQAPPRIRAWALLRCGWLSRNAGVVELESALLLFRIVDDPEGLALTLASLGERITLGDYDRGMALLEESLALVQQMEQLSWVTNYVLMLFAACANDLGDYTRASAFLEQALGNFRQSEDWHGIAGVFSQLTSTALRQLDFAAARKFSEEHLYAERRIGGQRGELLALMHLGESERYLGNLEQAKAIFEEDYRQAARQSAQWDLSIALMFLGKIANDQGDYLKATHYFLQSLEEARGLPTMASPLYDNLEGLAYVALNKGDPVRAACLFGAAEMLHEKYKWPLLPQKQAEYASYLVRLHNQLDPEAFTFAWSEGKAMTPESAVAYAKQ